MWQSTQPTTDPFVTPAILVQSAVLRQTRASVMACSQFLLFKRAFVSVLLATAAVCKIVLNATRDSPEKGLLRAFRQVAKRAHPEKGCSTAKFQKLLASKEAWEKAVEKGRLAHRPTTTKVTLAASTDKQSNRKPVYRARGVVAMLFFFGV